MHPVVVKPCGVGVVWCLALQVTKAPVQPPPQRVVEMEEDSEDDDDEDDE